MKCSALHLMIILIAGTSIYGQTPTIHDCLGAIPICKAVYTQSSLPDGEGNYPNEINGVYDSGGWCCMDDELNSVWYTFTANNDGNFGFILTPNDLEDDYDWALFDLTNAKCEDIYDTESLNISCNAAGSTDCLGVTGPDGSEIYHFQGRSCKHSPPSVTLGFNPFNDLVPVVKGNTYVLIVSNWEGQSGFTIDFSLSINTGIIDEINPEIAAVDSPKNCGDNTFGILFSENIQCNTVIGNNFSISGPGGPYNISLAGSMCDIGATYTREFEFLISPPLTIAGTYTISINSPMDILDLCDNPLLDGSVATFDIETGFPMIELGNDTILCNETNFILDATTPGALSYQWQDNSNGNTFNAIQSGSYSVTVDFGGGCYGFDEINLTFNQTTDLLDLGPDTLICEPEAWILGTNIPGVISYLWQDGSTNSSINIENEGLYWLEIELGENCLERDSINISFSSETEPINLGLDQQICQPGANIILDAGAPNAIQFEWQDGSSSSTFDAADDGIYWVIATFDDGCMVNDSIELDFSLFILEPDLGNDTILCAGETFLIQGLTPNAESYIWQDGSTSETYPANTTGWYWLSVNADEACPETDSIYLTFESGTQILDLGNDTIICFDQPLLLDVNLPGANDFEWSDGSNSSTLLIEDSGNYAVTVTSNDCLEYIGSINITARDCQPCDFYVPNIFTPNNDGINDYFTPNISCNYTNYQLFVYNRWGSLVFRSSDPLVNWHGTFNGEKAEIGVYTYFIQYIYNNELRIISGDVSLIR